MSKKATSVASLSVNPFFRFIPHPLTIIRFYQLRAATAMFTDISNRPVASIKIASVTFEQTRE